MPLRGVKETMSSVSVLFGLNLDDCVRLTIVLIEVKQMHRDGSMFTNAIRHISRNVTILRNFAFAVTTGSLRSQPGNNIASFTLIHRIAWFSAIP